MKRITALWNAELIYPSKIVADPKSVAYFENIWLLCRKEIWNRD